MSAPPAHARARRPPGRRLGRRELAKQLTIGQTWCERDTGAFWTVRQVWRGQDRQALLERPGQRPRTVAFAELSRGYRLLEEQQ